ADGRYVAFRSTATDLVPGYVNGNPGFSFGDVYLRDLQTNTTRLVTRNAAGTASGNSYYLEPQISPDGRFVVFSGYASNLVAGDANNDQDVFAYDAQADVIRLVSANAAGTGSANKGSTLEALAADGRTVIFGSQASDLVSPPL